MEYRLKYEFAHLEQTASAGFDSTYYDFTDFMVAPDGIKFVFGEDDNIKETENQVDSQGFERSVAGTHEAFEDLCMYIKHWLIDHADAGVNMIKVRITDMSCAPLGKSLGIWTINTDNLDWCDDDECKLTFELREYRPLTGCLQQTVIWDNHRNFFPDDGIPYGKVDTVTGLPITDTHLHPRFRYCDDIKPQALQNFLFVIAQGIVSGLFLMVSVILAIAIVIQDLINAVFGSGTADFADNLEDSIIEEATTITQNLLGCGRMHPAPLVRNYFINACTKCINENGVRLQFESNIFNDPGGDLARYYDTCLLFAPQRLGYKINSGNEPTDYRDWLIDNRPNETALTLAASLKDIFNAKYRIENGYFKFNTKNSFPVVTVFDFTDDADRALMLGNICYSWNAEKKYASTKLDYSIDSHDQSGNEALHRYNGAKDWATDNPRFEGIKQIIAHKYGVARFANDGIEQKRIFSVTGGTSFAEVMEWADDVMLLQKDVTALYKLLIWDGESDPYDANVVKINTEDYNISHWPDDWIVGESPTSPYYVFNDPLFFFEAGEGFDTTPNLFSLHEIDDPTSSGLQNKEWRVTLELCCTTLHRIIDDDTLGDGVFAHLDYLIKLPPTGNGLEQKGNIKSVTLDYQNGTIELRGDIKYTI